MDYDEEAELNRYILRYHQQLLTPFEQRVEKAAYARTMYAGRAVGKLLLEQWGGTDDAKINDALAEGMQAFYRQVIARILAEQPGLAINRCPKCSRVLRTPDARQCSWCGHDWHDSG